MVNILWLPSARFVILRYVSVSIKPGVSSGHVFTDQPPESVRLRFAFLQQLNNHLETFFLPLVDLRPSATFSRSTAALLSKLRSIIFYDSKINFLNRILNATAKRKPDQAAPEITLDPLEGIGGRRQWRIIWFLKLGIWTWNEKWHVLKGPPPPLFFLSLFFFEVGPLFAGFALLQYVWTLEVQTDGEICQKCPVLKQTLSEEMITGVFCGTVVLFPLWVYFNCRCFTLSY